MPCQGVEVTSEELKYSHILDDEEQQLLEGK